MKKIQQVSLWDEELVPTILAGIRIAPGSAEYEELTTQLSSSPTKEHCSLGLPMYQPSLPTTLTEMRCSHCQTTFTHRQEQVTHYRLDWHRNNLRRSMAGKPPLTEEQFMEESSDISSISGSEDDSSDTEDEDKTSTADTSAYVLEKQARLFFLNAEGSVISLYRNILYSKYVQIDGEKDVIQRAMAVPHKNKWAVILLGGGHFAAAVFRGKDVVIHKTFHNYTVRAKQGGGQSSRDSQSGTSHPKSSGASLRRYNEQSQRQHIQELMESWKVHLEKCDLIFYHAKHHSRAALFSGKKPILMREDERLRRIPFSTKRAKFSEVKRIHGHLSEILVHGKEEEFTAMVRESKLRETKPNTKSKKENKSSPKKTEKKLKTERKASLNLELEDSSHESGNESSEEMELVTQLSTLTTSDLGGPDNSLRSRSKKKAAKSGNKSENENKQKKSASNKSKGKSKGCPHKTRVWDVLLGACKAGNIGHLSAVLKMPSATQEQDNGLSQEVLESIASTDIPANISCITFGSKSRTMLHVAAENGQKDVVWWLLEHGCNPSVADGGKRTPYEDASDKECRNIFRRFMAEWPEKYNYKMAKIPSPLTQELEAEQAVKQALRRKAQRQAKLERQREKKQQERIKKEQEEMLQKEEEEKKRFLDLSDREKRALAAERRFLKQQEGAQAPASCLLRCFTCGTDITGKIPFEYSDNKFCTTKCVREHRLKNS